MVEVVTLSHHRNTEWLTQISYTATHRHRKLLLTYKRTNRNKLKKGYQHVEKREKLTIWMSVTMKPTADV